jgi:hypothetical protein
MKPLRMLDLFAGRFGWGKAFAARGWEVVGVDLTIPPDIPEGCTFVQRDILTMTPADVQGFDFICASSPCEQFSVHGMKHFHPNPSYPTLGIELFNHTRMLCEASGAPYVMENVRPAQKFVGNAANHCGPFYLWGNGVPPLLPQGIIKGLMTTWIDSHGRTRTQGPQGRAGRPKGEGTVEASKRRTAKAATIPPELASCVADYAERIIEQRIVA